MKRRGAGFTLIELMIVVSIIAIVASIAIPNLLRSRMAANEAAAMASLKTIATSQTSFRRQDYNFTGHIPSVREYAVPFTNLYQLDGPNPEVLQFIDESLANAHFFSATNPLPRSGYFFHEVLNRMTAAGDSIPVDKTVNFAVFAAPGQYNLTGLNSYFVDDKGVVWQRDTGEGVSETFLMNMAVNPTNPPFNFLSTSSQ